MNIDIQKLLNEFENKSLGFFFDDTHKKRHLTEDFIKGLWIQTILKKNPKLFVYQDARVRYWEKTAEGKTNPDQYVDLIITNKKNLDYKKEFQKIWKEWPNGPDEMVVCEIKLSSTTVPSRIEDDKKRIRDWYHLYGKKNLHFYFVWMDIKNHKIEKYDGCNLYEEYKGYT